MYFNFCFRFFALYSHANYELTVGIKKCKSIIKKKKKKHGKIVLLAKSKLNSIEVLISKALIDSNTSHKKLILINNVLKECEYTCVAKISDRTQQFIED